MVKYTLFKAEPKTVVIETSGAWTAELTPEEYQAAINNAAKMWVNNKKPAGVYGAGLLNTKEDPHKTERIGKSVEILFSGVFDTPATLVEGASFTKHDFKVDSVIIETTSLSNLTSNKKMRKVSDKNGDKKIEKFDFIVVARVLEDNPTKQIFKASFLGWISKKEFDALPTYRHQRQKEFWDNKDIPVNKLHSMNELREQVNKLNGERRCPSPGYTPKVVPDGSAASPTIT